MKPNNTPYTIINKNTTDYPNEKLMRVTHPAMCELNLNEMKLLTYYASCETGFAPAALTVFQDTGIAKNKMYAARNSLTDKKYITVDDDKKTLTINWEALVRESIAITMLRKCEDEIKETTGMTASGLFKTGTHYTEEPRKVRRRRRKEQSPEYDTPASKFEEMIYTMRKFTKDEHKEILGYMAPAYEHRFGEELGEREVGLLTGEIKVPLSNPSVEYGVPKEWAYAMGDIIDLNVPEPAPHPDEVPLPF